MVCTPHTLSSATGTCIKANMEDACQDVVLVHRPSCACHMVHRLLIDDADHVRGRGQALHHNDTAVQI